MNVPFKDVKQQEKRYHLVHDCETWKKDSGNKLRDRSVSWRQKGYGNLGKQQRVESSSPKKNMQKFDVPAISNQLSFSSGKPISEKNTVQVENETCWNLRFSSGETLWEKDPVPVQKETC